MEPGDWETMNQETKGSYTEQGNREMIESEDWEIIK
jgi:hypothetical protein